MSVILMSFERISLADEARSIIFASISIDKKVMAEVKINFGLSDGHYKINTNLISDDGKNIVRC